MTQATSAPPLTQEDREIMAAGNKMLDRLYFGPPEDIADLGEIRDRLDCAIRAEDYALIERATDEAIVALGLRCPTCGEDTEQPVEEFCCRECYDRNGIDDGGAL